MPTSARYWPPKTSGCTPSTGSVFDEQHLLVQGRAHVVTERVLRPDLGDAAFPPRKFLPKALPHHARLRRQTFARGLALGPRALDFPEHGQRAGDGIFRSCLLRSSSAVSQSLAAKPMLAVLVSFGEPFDLGRGLREPIYPASAASRSWRFRAAQARASSPGGSAGPGVPYRRRGRAADGAGRRRLRRRLNGVSANLPTRVPCRTRRLGCVRFPGLIFLQQPDRNRYIRPPAPRAGACFLKTSSHP